MQSIRIIATLLQIPIVILFPIGVGLFFHRWQHVPWKVFFTGVLSYVCAELFVIPLTFLLWKGGLLTSWYQVFWLSALVALAEETMRYLSFRLVPIMHSYRTWGGALMAGVGHGGTEMIAVGLSDSVVPLLIYFLVPGNSQEKQLLSQFFLSAPLWLLFLAGLLRVTGVLCQIGLATLSALAYRRSFLFYPLAIVVHFLADFLTYEILTRSLLWSELLFQALGLLAVAFVLAMRRSKTLAREPGLSAGQR